MIGEAFGNFRIVSRLGRGGMGEVYLAEQQNIGTRVAVKLLLPEISADAEHVQRFFNEARAVSRIQHAGIVKIFDVGFHPSGQAYLVMEFLEGESLGSRIRRTFKMSPAHIADLGRQIASVLEATHSAGITHRDLKPDNIYIVPDRELASRQRAKVLDFGIAKLTGTLAHASPRTMGTMGTPAYMAPEQWGDASKVDWRADIYSLGCLVFEMACGRPPFVVTTLAEACGKHLTEIPLAASALAPGLPPELDELIACMLEKRPDDRPQSMEVVVRRFEAIAAIVGPPPPMVLAAPNVHPSHPSSTPSGRAMADADLGATVGTQLPVRDHGVAPTVGTEPPPPRATGTAPRLPERPALEAKRSKLPIAIVALLVVGASGGAGAYFLRGRKARVPRVPVVEPPQPKAEEPFACDAPLAVPPLDGASNTPVALRYASKPLEASEVTSTIHTTWKVDSENAVRTGDRTLSLVSTLDWGAQVGDTIHVDVVVTKLAFDDESRVQEPGKATEVRFVRWRSDDPAAQGELDSLRSLLGHPIKLQMTSRGQLKNDPTPALKTHLQGKRVPAHIIEAFTRDELFRMFFIELPEPDVTVGGMWRGGELIRKLPSRGQIVAPYEFTVYAESGNAKQFVIEARPKLKLDVSGRIKELAPQRTAFEVWALFDVARGELASLQSRACARMSIELDGKRVDADAMLHSTSSSRKIEQANLPAAIPPPRPVPVPPPTPMPDQAGGGSVETELPQKPDGGAVARLLARQNTTVAACGIHQRDLKTVAVRVQIAPDGSVASVAAAGNAALKVCIEPQLQRLRFPPSATGDVITRNYALTSPRGGD